MAPSWKARADSAKRRDISRDGAMGGPGSTVPLAVSEPGAGWGGAGWAWARKCRLCTCTQQSRARTGCFSFSFPGGAPNGRGSRASVWGCASQHRRMTCEVAAQARQSTQSEIRKRLRTSRPPKKYARARRRLGGPGTSSVDAFKSSVSARMPDA